jgi:hypothetical protein
VTKRQLPASIGRWQFRFRDGSTDELSVEEVERQRLRTARTALQSGDPELEALGRRMLDEAGQLLAGALPLAGELLRRTEVASRAGRKAANPRRVGDIVRRVDAYRAAHPMHSATAAFKHVAAALRMTPAAVKAAFVRHRAK